MKWTTPFLAFGVLIVSCSKDNTPKEMLDEMINPQATLIYAGNFINGPYGSVAGKASVYQNPDNKLQLRLEGFTASNGPDLKVYLSKEVQPVNFINLGDLKSVNGNQVYDIPGNPNLMDYRYALIHCKQFNHLFGSAQLNKQ